MRSGSVFSFASAVMPTASSRPPTSAAADQKTRSSHVKVSSFTTAISAAAQGVATKELLLLGAVRQLWSEKEGTGKFAVDFILQHQTGISCFTVTLFANV